MSSDRSFAAAELAARASRSGDEPFLFFRDERGQFTWWSWARSARASGEREPQAAAERVAWRFLRDLHEAELGPSAGERIDRFLGELDSGSEREIWISSGRLAEMRELALASVALRGGWVVLREPAAAPPAEAFLWARPTIVSGTAGEIEGLAGEVERLAPHWRRSAWLRRRLARLRTALIAGEGAGEAGRRLATLGARCRVLPFPPDGW